MLIVFMILSALTISIYQCIGTLLLCFVHVYVDKAATVENPKNVQGSNHISMQLHS